MQLPLACSGTTAAEIFAHVASAGTVNADESVDAAKYSESESDKEETQTPATGSRPLPATFSGKVQPWVVKKLVTGRFQFMPLVAYAHVVEQDMWKRVDTNIAFQIHADCVFGPHLLEHGRPKAVERSVTALYIEFTTGADGAWGKQA